jgi:hypothetical protein
MRVIGHNTKDNVLKLRFSILLKSWPGFCTAERVCDAQGQEVGGGYRRSFSHGTRSDHRRKREE